MKKLVGFAFVLFLIASFAFAASSNATLNISAYKNQTNLPSDGTVKVYIYDTTSGQSSTAEVDSQVDVTSYVTATENTIFDGYKDIFSIEVKTNLASSVNIDIKFSPFTNQENQEDILETSYSLTASAGNAYSCLYYTTSEPSSGMFSRKTTYTYSFIKHTPSISLNSTTITVSDSSAKAILTLDVESKEGSVSKTFNSGKKPSDPSASDVTNWRTHTNSSSTGTLDYIYDDILEDNMVYVQMKLNTTKDKVTTNVEYVAPVTVMVTIE